MVYEGEIISDSLLCFISSARNDFSSETLFNTVNAYYSYENIKASKIILANLLKKDLVWRREPEKKNKELNDVFDFLDELISSKKKVKFVCDTYKGMPPVGFEYIAPIITNLCTDVAKLNDLLPKILDIKTEVTNTADTVRQLRVDFGDIKTKFGNAIEGLQAANEVAQDDLDIISDLRSFRNSIGNGNIRGALKDAMSDDDDDDDDDDTPAVLPKDTSYAAAASRDKSNVDMDSLIYKKKLKNGTQKLVSNPLTGAISKEPNLRTKNNEKRIKPNENKRQPYEENRITSEKEVSKNGDCNEVSGDDDNEGWTTVENNKRKNKFRLMGVGKGNGSRVIAVRRTTDAYLGRVDTSVQVDDIKSYIKDVFSVEVINIEKLNIKSDHFNSFKITVFTEERNKLFNSELWPEGMVVNKFFRRRV